MNPIYDRTTFEPGEICIVENLPYETYRAAKGIAGSDLDVLMKSPAEFKLGIRTEASPEMDFGTLFHSLLLTGRADYHVKPETYDADGVQKKWNGNANVCKEWLAAHQDKPIIPALGNHSAALLATMVTKVKAHPIANQLISRGVPEVSIFARHAECGTLCKGRIDRLIRNTEQGQPTVIVEVKTTRDASTQAFNREILKRGYYKKAAWYRMLFHQMKISPIEYWLLPVETNGQCRVNPRRLAERAFEKGEFSNDDALALYHKCKQAGHWPDFVDSPFPSDGPNIPEFDLPDYCYSVELDAIKGMTEVDDGEAA